MKKKKTVTDYFCSFCNEQIDEDDLKCPHCKEKLEDEGTNFMWQHRLTFSEKYQELNSTIKNLWYTEVCEKEIFPFLERAFQDK